MRGDLGHSYRDDSPVLETIGNALRYTLPLTLVAAVVAIGLAIQVSTWLAKPGRGRRTVLTTIYALDAVPLFVVASALLLLFANPDALLLFPAYGLGSQSSDESSLSALADFAYHLVLPVVSLVMVSLPGLVVQLEAALQHERGTDYATTARAKGLSEAQVIWRHTFRNALLPTLTLITEFLPSLVAGAVIVEMIFALPGMGLLLAEAAATRDYPVLMGGVVLTTLVRLAAQLLTDWLYVQADPRIRLQA
ncbi:ABC transporter permease [Hymenobacter jejuensis]|nr:ABC transporter permease [Hymenobacter jejuensis]